MHSFAGAVVTKCRRLGGLSNRNFPHGSGGWEARTQVSAGRPSPAAPLGLSQRLTSVSSPHRVLA